MSYLLHDKVCANCGAKLTICTPEEDEFGSSDWFEFVCPACAETMKFNPGAVIPSHTCPENAVTGFRVGTDTIAEEC